MSEQEYQKRKGIGSAGSNNSSSEEENLEEQVPEIDETMNMVTEALKRVDRLTKALNSERRPQPRRREVDNCTC